MAKSPRVLESETLVVRRMPHKTASPGAQPLQPLTAPLVSTPRQSPAAGVRAEPIRAPVRTNPASRRTSPREKMRYAQRRAQPSQPPAKRLGRHAQPAGDSIIPAGPARRVSVSEMLGCQRTANGFRNEAMRAWGPIRLAWPTIDRPSHRNQTLGRRGRSWPPTRRLPRTRVRRQPQEQRTGSTGQSECCLTSS